MIRSAGLRSAVVVGCGYLGERVARRLVERGARVVGTTRSPERLRELEAGGIPGALLDLARTSDSELTELLERLGPPDTVVTAVAPGRGGDARVAYRDGPLRLAEHLAASPPRRLVYVSSTGVYAQRGGEEVDEESPATSRERGHRWLREGEDALRRPEDAGLQRVPPAVILRLGGLYGPGRSPLEWLRSEPFRRRLRRGRRAFLNWIHVDDAAAAVVAAAEAGRPGEVYLVTDGAPVRRGDFYEEAARLAGLPPPVLEDDDDLGKRCRNRKMLEELGVELHYPDYRAGLRSLA